MYYDRVPTPRILWWGAILFCVIAIADSWFRWATFQYTTFDLAFYAQGLWLAGKGMAHVSLLDVPLMGNTRTRSSSLHCHFTKYGRIRCCW